jgi:hypothetical protein
VRHAEAVEAFEQDRGGGALMPEMPGTGAPSGRPTQTPMTVLPS